MGANGEPPVHVASSYTISIPSEWLSLLSSLKDLSPVLLKSITLHFLYNTYHHLESSHHLSAYLLLIYLFIIVSLPLLEGPSHEVRVLVGFVPTSRAWNIINLCLTC